MPHSMHSITALALTVLAVCFLSGCTRTLGDDTLGDDAAGDRGELDGLASQEDPREAGEPVPVGDGEDAGDRPLVFDPSDDEGEVRPRWQVQLEEGTREDQLVVLLALENDWQDEAFGTLVELLFADDPELRAAASRALVANVNREQAVELLDELRGREELLPVHAYATVAGLGPVVPVRALDLLVEHAIVPVDPLERRLRAIDALTELGMTASVPILIELGSDPDPEIGASAAGALAQLTFQSGIEDWGEWWRAHGDLERSDWARRRIDLESLAQLGGGRDGARLVAGAEPLDPATRRLLGDLLRALAFLGRRGGGAERVLAVARQGGPSTVRLGALGIAPRAVKLGVRREPLVTLLEEALDDEDLDVRVAVFRATSRGGFPELIPACIQALDDPELTIRDEAVGALRAFSGETHHYDPSAPADSPKRAFAKQVWLEWWDSYRRRRGLPEAD